MKRIGPWVAFAIAVAVPAYLAGQQSVTPEYQRVMDAFTAAYNKADAAGIGAHRQALLADHNDVQRLSLHGRMRNCGVSIARAGIDRARQA